MHLSFSTTSEMHIDFSLPPLGLCSNVTSLSEAFSDNSIKISGFQPFHSSLFAQFLILSTYHMTLLYAFMFVSPLQPDCKPCKGKDFVVYAAASPAYTPNE